MASALQAQVCHVHSITNSEGVTISEETIDVEAVNQQARSLPLGTYSIFLSLTVSAFKQDAIGKSSISYLDDCVAGVITILLQF